MGILYHGSSTRGIKRLEPRKSTHGEYVYATPHQELAIIFSGRAGDDLTYSLYRHSKDEPWKLVERIPGGFDAMFSNDASLYTVDDATFKDIKTGFAEVVSSVGVDILSEEYIPRVYDKIKELDTEGKIQMFLYPNRPMDMSSDDNDLIERIYSYARRENRGVEREDFFRLSYLHPDLINRINEVLIKDGKMPITQDDLVIIFRHFVQRQVENSNDEYYISNAFNSIIKVYPELEEVLTKEMAILNKNEDQGMAM